MKKPIRIQRKRIKGWRLPPNTVCVSRGTTYGNPFMLGQDGTPADVVELYRQHRAPIIAETARRELRGKNLACWCPLDMPCHADVLLEIANEEITKAVPSTQTKGENYGNHAHNYR